METITFRRDGMRAFWLVVCLAISLIWLSGCFVSWTPSDDAMIIQRTLCSALTVATWWVAINVTRSGIYAEEIGVVFRNFFRTRRARWDEILRFERPKPYASLDSGLAARLKSGGVVRSDLYGGTGLIHRDETWADDVVTTLNALLLERRGGLTSETT